MLNQLLLWRYLRSVMKAEHACQPTRCDGYTPAELAAFNRRMVLLRA